LLYFVHTRKPMVCPVVKFVALLVVFYCIALVSCKKDNASKSTTTTTITAGTFSIKCWNKTAGQITNFLSNNGRFKEEWEFGDGDTLSIPLGSGAGNVGPIDHIYKAPGIYTITLIVNGDNAHKTTQVDTIAPNYFFSYTGVPVTGDTIYFHFSAYLPIGVNYLWTFGDGTSSTDSIPYHIYSGAGNFDVKLTINGNPDSPDIYQVIPIYKDPVFTHQLTGKRLWHGTAHNYDTYDSASYNVYSTMPDTSFALTYINEVVISYADANFTFNPSLSFTDVIVFTAAPETFFYSSTSYIYYNHTKDSASIYLYGTEQPGPGQEPVTTEIFWKSP